ncbi:MAG: YbaB/EbfC family nucleoid-associated protein [Dehalococcoidia bacterium]|nr:YbaB/EbfC family nucleoid-associated protein [Dehalococcoidia bacterium]
MTSNNNAAPGGDTTPGALPDLDLSSLLRGVLGGAQDELSAAGVEGVAGGGAVRIAMTGDGAVVAVRLQPEAVDPGDIAMLEELLVSAFADARRQTQALKMQSAGRLAEAFGLGGLDQA